MFPDTVPKQVTMVGKEGLVRDLNPGPLAPKARIIPLDQRATIHTGASSVKIVLAAVIKKINRPLILYTAPAAQL